MGLEIAQLDVPVAAVGESPVWDEQSQALFWIDLLGCTLWRRDDRSGETISWALPATPGCVVLTASDSGLVALPDGIYALDFASGQVSPFAASAFLNDQTVLADGKLDRSGRLVVGASHRGMSEPVGGVLCLDSDACELRLIDDDIILANGPCWSPDNATFYHADSVRKAIYAYDYDIRQGRIANRRLFATTDEFGGIPDGATVDGEGFLWSAICEGGKLVRFTPDGAVDRIVEMPVRYPSSLCFGGKNFERIYVTSLSPAFLGREASPIDGATFVVTGLGIGGLPEPRFNG